MSILNFFVVLISLSHHVHAAFVCPTQAITLQQSPVGTTGSIPSNLSGLQLIPSNYSCDYRFDIPTGYVVKLNFFTDYNYDSENITYTDSRGKSYRLGTPMSNFPFVAVQPNAHVIIRTVTNTSKVLVQYQYIDITKFQQTKLESGNILNLLFTPNTFYTFNSILNDSIVLQFSKPYYTAQKSRVIRSLAYNYYIYDGSNILTSNFIGSLTDYLEQPFTSNGSSISLVNFYNSSYSDYIIANDKQMVGYLTNYTFSIIANDKSTYSQLYDLTYTGNSANTVYCVDCESVYLDQVTLSNDQSNVNVAPLTPTQRISGLLGYASNLFGNQTQVPQVIPANLFTIFAFNTNQGTISTRVNVDSTKFLTPSDGRQGFLFSPNLWKTMIQSKYSYYFNSNDYYKYNLNFLTHNLVADSRIEITIGGKDFVSKIFNSTSTSADLSATISGVGKYLNVTYNGGSTSNLTLQYTMQYQGNSAKNLGLFGVVLSVLLFLYV